MTPAGSRNRFRCALSPSAASQARSLSQPSFLINSVRERTCVENVVHSNGDKCDKTAFENEM